MEVAGWVVTPALSNLIESCISILRGPYKHFMNTRDNFEKLHLILTEILGIVTHLDPHSIENQHQNLWLRGIKDAVYDAEDLLDEFEYRVKEAKVKKSKSTVSYLASSSSYSVKQITGFDSLPKRLANIVNKLERMKSSAFNLHQIRSRDTGSTSAAQPYGIGSWRITGAVMDKNVETEMFGRETEKEGIVQQLVDEPNTDDHRTTPLVISIVGIGGMGKTTLAQLVYNDDRVTNYFDIKIWICVSNNFDVIKLTREILESVCEHDPKSEDLSGIAMSTNAMTDVMPQENNLTTLQNKLKANLESKKLLLVLDDVWDNKDGTQLEQNEAWKKLLSPLKHASIICKILVTTRIDIVARMLDTTHIVRLDGLSNTDIWLLLKHHALGNTQPSNISQLEEIGKEIAKKLKGSPLAAGVIGSMLKGKSDVNDWRELSKKDLSSEIMPLLKLSYMHLPDHLKQCFGYCSLFPKDWTFDPKDLVRHWVAHGYIQSLNKDSKEMAELGRRYFNDLLERYFFQTIRKDSTVTYVMHDLMHDLAEFVSRGECYRIDENWKEPKDIAPVRHLSIFTSNRGMSKIVATLKKKSKELKKLRTLIVCSVVYLDSSRAIEIEELIRLLKNLRVFSLKRRGRVGRVLLRFDHLLHLRYLQLDDYLDNQIDDLAKATSQLYHLQVVSVPRVTISGTTKFFEGLSAPTLITNSIDAALSGVPIDQFLSWTEKEWFRSIGKIKLRGSRTWEHLQPLGDLPLLNCLSVQEMSLVERIGEEFYGGNHNDRVKGFPSLEFLLIGNIPKLSKWSFVANYPLFPGLSSICIEDCPELKSLEGLQSLVSLKGLVILGCHNLKDGGGSTLPSSLQSLEIEHCGITDGCLSRWLQGHSSLSKLMIDSCHNLKDDGRSTLPSSLHSLEIGHCGITDGCLSRWLQGLSSLFELEIYRCDQLTSLPPATVLHGLTALRKLRIRKNERLASVEGVHALSSLRDVFIGSCPQLKALPSERLPSSVEVLMMWECHPELMKQVKERRGPEWDKISHIPAISMV